MTLPAKTNCGEKQAVYSWVQTAIGVKAKARRFPRRAFPEAKGELR
jgi:hypothetical protein